MTIFSQFKSLGRGFCKNRSILNIFFKIQSSFSINNSEFHKIHLDAFDGDFVIGNISYCLFSDIGNDKLFYDVIYNPNKTNFLLEGKKLGNKIENGKMMFIYQAQLSFKIWHNILQTVNNKLLD